MSLIVFAFIVSRGRTPTSREKYKALSPSRSGRYGIIVSSDQDGTPLTLKYDTVTGQAWKLVLPQTRWLEIKDYGSQTFILRIDLFYKNYRYCSGR